MKSAILALALAGASAHTKEEIHQKGLEVMEGRVYPLFSKLTL
jgi:hypothetical protein